MPKNIDITIGVTIVLLALVAFLTWCSLVSLENNRAVDAQTNQSRLACIEAGNQWITPNCVVLTVTP